MKHIPSFLDNDKHTIDNEKYIFNQLHNINYITREDISSNLPSDLHSFSYNDFYIFSRSESLMHLPNDNIEMESPNFISKIFVFLSLSYKIGSSHV